MSGATLGGQTIHETIVETMDDVAFVVDSDLELVYANEQSRRYIEVPEDPEDASILALTEELFVTPDERERFATTLATVVSDNADDVHEFPLTLELELTIGGKRLVEEVRLSPIREEGTVVGAVGIVRDVTERTRQEAQLRDTEQLLERLYRTAAESQPFEERLADILTFGAAYMDVEQGFLTNIEDGTQEIVVGVGENDQLQTGVSAPLSESYCRHTLDSNETPLTVLEASDQDWNEDPAFERFGLECYVGSPVTVDGELYGTICFADREAPDGEFTQTQETFVDLLTQWVGYELERQEREQHLERERDRVTALFETVPYPFVHARYDDGDPLVERVNDAFEETFGYDGGAIVGESLDELVVPDSHDESAVDINEQLTANNSVEREVVRETANGERRHFLFRAAQFNRDGERTETVAAYVDITDRKDRERELEAERAFIQSTINALPDTFYAFDEDGILSIYNDRVGEVTGYSPEQLETMHATDFIAEEDRDEAADAVAQILDSGEQTRIEVDYLTKDGECIPYEFTGGPLRGPRGELRGFVGIGRDITDRKEQERTLRETKQQLEAVLDTISAAVFLKDRDGRYLLVNREGRDLFGLKDTDIVGMTDEDLFPPEMAEQFRQTDRQVLERGETIEFEEEMPTDQGTKTHLTRKSPVSDDGDITALCAVSTDITDQKQRQRELEQFAYVASHDLREPLRVVSNYLQLLERRHGDQLEKDAREYVDFAVDAAERMNALIDGLLTYSRVDRRGDAFEPTDTADVVADARSNLEIAIEQHDAEISLAEGFPTVQGDHNQLVTVVQNLLDNAITYAGEDPPSIDISVEERERVWVFTVADDGVGMDPEQADRAFELFERLNADEEGTGLGLALCQKVIARHGGIIWPDTVPGEGTEVHFTLPKGQEGENS